MAQELLSFETHHIAERVNQVVEETLEYYKQSGFLINDTREDGSGTVEVSVDWSHGNSEEPHWEVSQVIDYVNGTVVGVRGIYWGNSYSYDPENNSLSMRYYYADNGNAQVHSLDCTVNSDGAELRETSRINIHTDLEVRYKPREIGSVNGFLSGECWYYGHIQLSEEDVMKILPNGRFISMEDMISTAVDPMRSSMRYSHEKIPEVHRTDAFIKLAGYDKTGHTTTFVSMPDNKSDVLHGFAHPLEDDPNGWLVIARYHAHQANPIARALVMSIDRDKTTVNDVNGVPEINTQVVIDGERYNISFLRRVGTYEEATEELLAVTPAENIHDSPSGKVTIFIPQSVEDFAGDVQKGHYFREILDHALVAYFGINKLNND